MADVFSKEKRSEIMSKIRSKNTKLEAYFCRFISRELYSMGCRYRRNYRKIPGCPDIAFPKYKLAIFIDGDFWHGYNFSKIKTRLPKKYWIPKIEKNILRDKVVNKFLKKDGWSVIRIWEHEIKKAPAKASRKIVKAIKNNTLWKERKH